MTRFRFPRLGTVDSWAEDSRMSHERAIRLQSRKRLA